MSQCGQEGGGGEHSQKERIRLLYTELALNPKGDFGWDKGIENARTLGYAEKWLEEFPAVVWESCAAVGNPFGLGPLNEGEIVVDIGCGAGTDLCLAAKLVGKSGRVIGVDLTAPMVEKALANAVLCGLSNVEAYIADMTQLPLPDEGADIVLSNGSINLGFDKPAVLREAFRILRVGGRLQIADMVRDIRADNVVATGNDSWADCVAGTLTPDCLKEMLAEVGFKNIELVEFTGYRTSPATIGATFRASKDTRNA